MGAGIWQIETRVNDLGRAVAFYSAAFDWIVTPVDDKYAMIDTGRGPIMSLWDVRDVDMPLGICHYVQSDDCEADAGCAVRNGGKIVLTRSEAPGSGAWTDTIDPWGGEVAFWQSFTGGQPEFSGSGRNPVVWIELGVGDYDVASRYYAALLGWMFEPAEGVPNYGVYKEFELGIGMQARAGGYGLTPYIGVDDVATACAAIVAAGGRIVREPELTSDGTGFALFVDPDQNLWGVTKLG